MKKVLTFFTIIFVILCLSSCFNKQEENNTDNQTNSIENQVSLLSIQGVEEKPSERQKTRYKTSNTTQAPDYQFVVLMDEKNRFDLLIKLDNPNDYHIFDFTLECDDENAKILIDNEYTLLTELKSINWKGDTNEQYRISMELSSEEYITTIEMTSMYYSDRESGENRYSVNLNNKENIDIYRLFQSLNVKIVDFWNYILNLDNENVDKNSIRIDNKEYNLGDSVEFEKNKTTITYDFILKNGIKHTYTYSYIKEKIYSNYTFIPKLEITINPIYINDNGVNVKVLDRKTNEVVFEKTLFESYYCFIEENTSNDYYFLVDGKEIK